jgi:hypothetical protein
MTVSRAVAVCYSRREPCLQLQNSADAQRRRLSCIQFGNPECVEDYVMQDEAACKHQPWLPNHLGTRSRTTGEKDRFKSIQPSKGNHMRIGILVCAIILSCTAAHAGPSRNLSLAADEPAQMAAPALEQPKPQASAAIERPKLMPDEQAKVPAPVQRPAVAEKPKRKYESTEARVIYELHRHGIYW